MCRGGRSGLNSRDLHSQIEIATPKAQVCAAMKFILTTHNVTLTDAIEQHILAKLDKLEHIDRWLLDARATLEKDHAPKTTESSYKCGIRLGVRGNDLYAEDKEQDLYKAIDLVTKKLEQQIRSKHSRVKAKTHKVAARLKEKRQTAKE